MDARLALVLALLAAGAARGLEGAREGPGDELRGYADRLGQLLDSEEQGPRAPPEEPALGSLLRSLLRGLQRPARSPAFLFQPQRFGRETRGSAGAGAEARLSARGWDLPAPQFWSMAAPQRFGRRK